MDIEGFRPHNIEPVFQDKVIYLLHRTRGGIFHRQDAEGGFALIHGLKDFWEGGEKQGGSPGQKLFGRFVGEGTGGTEYGGFLG